MSIQITRHPAPELGILGAGRMGRRLAIMFARAGRRVLLGSRDPQRARAQFDGDLPARLQIGDYDAALAAPAVLPAVFLRDGLLPLLQSLHPQLRGKLLIDISNPFNEDYSDFLTPWDSSGSEQIEAALPEVELVGAFKNVFAEVFDQPDFDGQLSDVLVVGAAAAQAKLAALTAGTPFRYLDAGPLRNARTVERLTLLTGRLGRQIGAYPRMAWRLLGGPAADQGLR